MEEPPAEKSASDDLTGLLNAWTGGNQAAANRLMSVVYPKLRALASYHMRHERPGHTLQPTALVNELYMNLFSSQPIQWKDRAHFFAFAARELRRILVDHARKVQAEKRGGKQVRLTLSQAEGWYGKSEQDLIDLHEALERLEQLDSRAARGVELRFFGGLHEEEAAEVLGISTTTFKRDWKFARAWLLRQLSNR